MLANQSLGVNPTERVGIADIELAGIVAQDHGPGNATGIADAAPERTLGGDLHRVRKHLHAVNAECGQMGPPFIGIGKAPLPVRGETPDRLVCSENQN